MKTNQRTLLNRRCVRWKGGAWLAATGAALLVWCGRGAEPAAVLATVDSTATVPTPNRDAALRRLGPEVPKTIESSGGLVRFLFKDPKPSHLLQLVNPFARAGYGAPGGKGSPFGPRPLPRAFRNERTHEPSGILVFSVSR